MDQPTCSSDKSPSSGRRQYEVIYYIIASGLKYTLLKIVSCKCLKPHRHTTFIRTNGRSSETFTQSSVCFGCPGPLGIKIVSYWVYLFIKSVSSRLNRSVSV